MRRFMIPFSLCVLLSMALLAQSSQTGEQSHQQTHAKITMQQAERTAQQKEPGTIQSKELEQENGRLIYSFDIITGRGTREVNVDARTGRIVEDSVESPAKEAREQALEQKSSTVPAALVNTGEFAENIYDAARADNWKMANRQLTKLQAAAQKVNAVKSRKAQLLMAVSTLESSLRARDPLHAMEEANQITRIAAEMSARYHPVVPVQVALLDYYGRRLQVVSTRGDQLEMNHTAKNIVTTWRQVRGELQHRNAEQVIASWDKLAKEIQSARSQAQFQQVAQKELNQVDRLEKVFERRQSAALRR